jgi:flagellar biosynthesis component FlhA
MEWFTWVAPIATIIGLIVTAAVGYYRIGQNEKKTDQNKIDQEKQCAQCHASQKEQRATDEAKQITWQNMIQRLMEMHTAQVMANAQEHSSINITAARTEEQLKHILAKMEDLSHAIHRIERDMPREYHPSPGSNRFEKKG